MASQELPFTPTDNPVATVAQTAPIQEGVDALRTDVTAIRADIKAGADSKLTADSVDDTFRAQYRQDCAAEFKSCLDALTVLQTSVVTLTAQVASLQAADTGTTAGTPSSGTTSDSAGGVVSKPFTDTSAMGWQYEGAPAMKLHPQDGWPDMSAAWIGGLVSAGNRTFTAPVFDAPANGVLTLQMAAVTLVKQVLLNGKEVGGLPYVSWDKAKKVTLTGFKPTGNTLQIVVQVVQDGLCALSVGVGAQGT